jgi:hypothetical protein
MSSCWFNLRPQDFYIPDSGSNSEDFVIVPGIREPYPTTWTLDEPNSEPVSSSAITESSARSTIGSSTSSAMSTTEATAVASNMPETTTDHSQPTKSIEEPASTSSHAAAIATSIANSVPRSGESNSLSTGLKVGIGILVATTVIGSAFLAFYLLARRNQRRELALSNNMSEVHFARQMPRITRVISDTPSYSTTAPISQPLSAPVEQSNSGSERGDSPQIGSIRSGSLQNESLRGESTIELSHIDSALHELYSPMEVHEIGPGRWENTGFNFPPEKSARC